MTTVAIIGAGDVGGAVAHGLATREAVHRVVLIDAARGVAAGKALDIQQSGAISGSHTSLEGTDDVTRAAGCLACVIADRAGQPPAEWTGDEGLALLMRVTKYAGAVPFVFAGPSQGPLLAAGAREARIDPTHLIGSSTEAYASALRAMVAAEAGCSAVEVSLTVLGAPPSGLVVPWSGAAIGGRPIEGVLSQVQLARLEARAARVWPPGPHALGMAAALVVEAMGSTARRALSVLTVLDGEFGVRSRAGALPAVFGAGGIVKVHPPALNPRERVQLQTALEA